MTSASLANASMKCSGLQMISGGEIKTSCINEKSSYLKTRS